MLERNESPTAHFTGPLLDLPPHISYLEGLGEKVQHRGSDPCPEWPPELHDCCGSTHPTHRFCEQIQCSWREESVQWKLSPSLAWVVRVISQLVSASHLTLIHPRSLPVASTIFLMWMFSPAHTLPWIPITCKTKRKLLNTVYTSL